MREILDLKQFLLEGNFPEALRLTTELETMARQDKINALTRPAGRLLQE